MGVCLCITGSLKGNSYWKWLWSQKCEPIVCLPEWSPPCYRVSRMVTKSDPTAPPGSCAGMLNFICAKDVCHCPFWCCVMRATSVLVLMIWDHLQTSLYLHIRVWSHTPMHMCSGCPRYKEPHLRAYWAPGRCLISWKNVCIFIIMILSPHISDMYISLQQMAVEYILLTNLAYYNNFLTNESKVTCSNRIYIFFF